MEDKLTSSSDILFANVLNNILSDNCNFLKNLIFLLGIASETEQLKMTYIHQQHHTT